MYNIREEEKQTTNDFLFNTQTWLFFYFNTRSQPYAWVENSVADVYGFQIIGGFI